MDSSSNQHQQATTSTSQHIQPEVRSSARVKAAKQKAKDKPDDDQSSSAVPQTRARSKRTAKSKVNESADTTATRAAKRCAVVSFVACIILMSFFSTRRNPPQPALIINEPVRDPKGKKRAAPEPNSEEEDSAGPSKRPRTTSYSLRSSTRDMPRKTRLARRISLLPRGKAAVKSKAAMAVAGSSRLEDEDTEMLDAEYNKEEEAEEHHDDGGNEEGHPEEDDEDDDDEDGGGEGGEGGIPGGAPGIPGGLDETTAMAIFGDYRQFGSYMLSLSSRLKTMLNNIKTTADPTTRLVTLQELSELLSISTEDTLAGSFQVEQFVRELVKILGGRGNEEDEDDDGGGEEPPEQDEDAALAAALAMSSGGYQGDDNLEAQVLACRCLANLMEALPGVAHTVVYHGAIPVLCSKLIEISYIDLAEQTLSTMEKISEEFPSSIVREGGLAALLNYLDFFSIAVQRTALQAASNCCRNIAPDHSAQIRGVWPIIRNCLSYSDQRLVEFACLCVIRVIDSYHRASVENLEALVDTELIRAVNMLLLPAGAPLVAANTYTLLVRALATAARASPKITLALLEADIVDTLYQILTGVLPPAGNAAGEQGGASGGQGLGGGLADMTVMENLAHRPKDQVEETLSLVSELMPPLPKDGVFDHKGYTEKSLARMVKAKAKAERAAARQAAHASLAAAMLIAEPPAPKASSSAATADETTSTDTAVADPEDGAAGSAPSPDRFELLRSKPAVVGRFMELMVPILIDVYAASVITPVRVKTLTGLLKAVSFLDADGLKRVLTFVPVASFASSILSSKDHPTLVIGALQLVDLLLAKVPAQYKPTFRREGVFHEIEVLSGRNIISPAKPSKEKEASSSSSARDKEKEKETEKEASESPAPPEITDIPPPPAASSSGSASTTIPGFKKLTSLSLEPEDAITLRARVIQFKYLSGDDNSAGDGSFGALQRLVEQIGKDGSEKEAAEALREMAELFGAPHSSVSSFELLQSGAVDGLLQFATDGQRKLSLAKRKELLLDAFTSRRTKLINGTPTPFSTFVKKLQESLTRMESFDVITVAQGADDSKRSSPSLLARQLRLRLVAGDESDVPRNLHNIVVSIHAIATFQALHDYLRPRVAGLLGSGSRLSGMLAALAASGFTGSPIPTPGEAPPQPPAPAAAESSSAGASASGSTITRRRSQRLSAKNAAPVEASASTSDAPVAGPSSDGAAGSSNIEAAPPSNMIDSEMTADFTDEEEVDAEVFDDDVDPDNSIADKTVTLSIAEDGSKVEAQTPDGTRVATPSLKEGQPSVSRAPTTRASYASALKAKPTDWHLEFSMDDQVLPLDLTIYGAMHQHEMRKKTGALPPNLIWQGVYTVKFKKVPGPAPATDVRPEGGEGSSKGRSPSPTLSSLPEDAPHAKILRLLRVLHQLNMLEAERSVFVGEKRNLPESAFVNNKLTAKLTRQLEEPMIVASSCLPDWALDLPQHFPFLFPFATRYNFLQSTSFGYARLILKWQSQQARVQDTSRRDEGIGFLGRLQRQKVRISRKHILESAVKVFELYGSSSSVLEVEYFEEVGTGLGPTLEFYSLVSKEFARKDLKIWRDGDAASPSPYVDHPSGLHPAPISPEDIATDGGQKRTHIFRVIGQFVAKAMLDSRIIDLSLNKIFVKIVLGEEVPLTIATLRLVDISLANSLDKIQAIVSAKAQVENDKLKRKVALLETVSIDDLALDFTIPGYDIELRPGGRDIAVTADNVEEYVHEVLDAIIGQGVQLQAKAFREGFSKVFPISDLQAFSADELVLLFGNSDEDWSIETLSEAVKADHGFNGESRAIRDLVEIMAEYDATTRRNYLQFVTGSPKLPIGGFRGLNPPLTVVRKPHEAPLTADDYLPSVMTCVNYLKLPEYSSKAIMREKLRIAIQEGMGSFHLS
ncbi:Ubiquitin fusion degradation protein 4 [Mycena sanguinolenta]|uniref:HECT-type E3 ubiquitin transferase n=1 Tax=Mycena sanguinolenta TaxID=230812 RepID=A0A8H6Z0E9_9AGAR|nr:Ubiquitin fusion degradation protein 4 [Mycena sanguinolenta]